MNPEALRHELLFAGYPDNGFLEFQSAFDFQGEPKSVVGIDPTWCLCEDDGSATPTCYAQCTKISLTDLTGVCCSCQGATYTYVRSAYSATTYLCQQ